MNDDTGEQWRVGLIGFSCVLVLVGLLGWRLRIADLAPAAPENTSSRGESDNGPTGWRASRSGRTAEEIVASKVTAFGRSRRVIASALAARDGVEVPGDVKRFFDAVEAGDWGEIDHLFTELSELMRSEGRPKDLEACWPAVMDTLGCVAEARKWPAEKLLDYADAVLGSLRSGMIYVGGTDPGRFIPTLVGETSSGEKPVVITQNALADRLYLDYVGFLYKDRIAALTQGEQDAAFADYIADARKRLEHDLKSPHEPKQLAPGESVRFKDGQSGDVVAEGQTSVMAINERLLRRLMEKNPDLSFAVEESFPMKSTYGEATVIGPIMELRAAGTGNELTARKASDAVEYWEKTRETLLSDKENSNFSVLATWSKMAAGQANLFLDRKLFQQAEETYRLAQQIFPGCPEATYGLAELLQRRGQLDEARQLVENFHLKHSVREPPPEAFPPVTSAP